jgi:hypothetical protein
MATIKCEKQFTLRSEEFDMPLTEAVYDSATDKIFAVRDQWVFRFNADTGFKEAEARIVNDQMSKSTVSIVNGILYVGLWTALNANYTTGDTPAHSDIFTVNKSTLVATATGWIPFYTYASNRAYSGVCRIIPGAATIANRMWGAIGVNADGIFVINPLVGVTTLKRSSYWGFESLSPFSADLTYDSLNDKIWAVYAGGVQVTTFRAGVGNPFQVEDSAANVGFVTGICFANNVNRAYVVNLTSTIGRMVTFGSNIIRTDINTGVTGANPLRIKYNPNDGLVYIPNWGADSVSVMNPHNETFQTHTGFTAPIDIVFTPTKKWVIQNYKRGLQELT